MPEQIQTPSLEVLERLIEDSVLLSSKRKTELLAVLPSLMETQGKELLRILQSEDDILSDLAKSAITRAVEQGDEEFLEELDAFLRNTMKKLRKAEEGTERGEETEQTEHFFDDMP
ncbi:MAG: hypothetical protein AAB853_01800 [Patescibacteria group bacterium]